MQWSDVSVPLATNVCAPQILLWLADSAKAHVVALSKSIRITKKKSIFKKIVSPSSLQSYLISEASRVLSWVAMVT